MGITQVTLWADTTLMVLRPTHKQTHLEVIQPLSGGYSQESTTTYQSGSSSNTTTTTNNTKTHIQVIQE